MTQAEKLMFNVVFTLLVKFVDFHSHSLTLQEVIATGDQNTQIKLLVSLGLEFALENISTQLEKI